MVTWRVWEHILCLWPTPCSVTHHPRLSLNKGSPGGGSPHTKARHCRGRHIGIQQLRMTYYDDIIKENLTQILIGTFCRLGVVEVMVHNTLITKKNKCIDLILGSLNTGTYRLLKYLPPPPTGENLQNNLQHTVVFKTTRLQTLRQHRDLLLDPFETFSKTDLQGPVPLRYWGLCLPPSSQKAAGGFTLFPS